MPVANHAIVRHPIRQNNGFANLWFSPPAPRSPIAVAFEYKFQLFIKGNIRMGKALKL
jgi:hypothetical protein